jgi:hypothetical protein
LSPHAFSPISRQHLPHDQRSLRSSQSRTSLGAVSSLRKNLIGAAAQTAETHAAGFSDPAALSISRKLERFLFGCQWLQPDPQGNLDRLTARADHAAARGCTTGRPGPTSHHARATSYNSRSNRGSEPALVLTDAVSRWCQSPPIRLDTPEARILSRRWGLARTTWILYTNTNFPFASRIAS